MKHLLFITALLLTSNVFAATGDGHAQAELAKPLSVTHWQSVYFGTIAIDPAAGPQVVELVGLSNSINCPATYVCSGSPTRGVLQIRGAPNTSVQISFEGSTATLSDGLGNTVIFDPEYWTGVETASLSTSGSGDAYAEISGEITFTGTEPSGTYSSTNAGGSGYTVTVNY